MNLEDLHMEDLIWFNITHGPLTNLLSVDAKDTQFYEVCLLQASRYEGIFQKLYERMHSKDYTFHSLGMAKPSDNYMLASNPIKPLYMGTAGKRKLRRMLGTETPTS